MSRYQKPLLVAIHAALDAGKAILKIYDRPVKVQYKSDQSPLTEADQEAHAIIMKKLRKETPGIPILSEEGRAIPYEERCQWERFWLVDPLDGTKEFIKRNGEFTVNIALIEGDKPVLGVISVPCRDQLYFACQGEGAYKIDSSSSSGLNTKFSFQMLLNAGKRLPSQTTVPKNTIRVVGSRSHGSEAFEQYIQSLKAEYRSVEVTPAGSSLKFCLVAEGKAEIYPRLGSTMEWDTAAGHAICEQAGSTVNQWGVEMPLYYNKPNLLNPFFNCSTIPNNLPAQ